MVRVSRSKSLPSVRRVPRWIARSLARGGGGRPCGAEEGAAVVEDDLRGHPRADRTEAPFVAEGCEEGAVAELGEDLRRDAASQEDTTRSQTLQGEVARLAAEDRGVAFQRPLADRVPLGERRLGDGGCDVSQLGDPVLQPAWLRFPRTAPLEPAQADE